MAKMGHVTTASEDQVTSSRDHVTSLRDHVTLAPDHVTLAPDHVTSSRDHVILALVRVTSSGDRFNTRYFRIIPEDLGK